MALHEIPGDHEEGRQQSNHTERPDCRESPPFGFDTTPPRMEKRQENRDEQEVAQSVHHPVSHADESGEHACPARGGRSGHGLHGAGSGRSPPSAFRNVRWRVHDGRYADDLRQVLLRGELSLDRRVGKDQGQRPRRQAEDTDQGGPAHFRAGRGAPDQYDSSGKNGGEPLRANPEGQPPGQTCAQKPRPPASLKSRDEKPGAKDMEEEVGCVGPHVGSGGGEGGQDGHERGGNPCGAGVEEAAACLPDRPDQQCAEERGHQPSNKRPGGIPLRRAKNPGDAMRRQDEHRVAGMLVGGADRCAEIALQPLRHPEEGGAVLADTGAAEDQQGAQGAGQQQRRPQPGPPLGGGNRRRWGVSGHVCASRRRRASGEGWRRRRPATSY